MKLRIEIDDLKWSALKKALTMTTEEYREGRFGTAGNLATNILMARQSLDLSMSEDEICTDKKDKFLPEEIIAFTK